MAQARMVCSWTIEDLQCAEASMRSWTIEMSIIDYHIDLIQTLGGNDERRRTYEYFDPNQRDFTKHRGSKRGTGKIAQVARERMQLEFLIKHTSKKGAGNRSNQRRVLCATSHVNMEIYNDKKN